MPREYERMKYTGEDSSDSSDSSSDFEKYQPPIDPIKNRPCIIHPPISSREKYESSDSDRSRSDFADLCEDKPRKKNNKDYSVIEPKNYNDFSRKSIASDASARKNPVLNSSIERSIKKDDASQAPSSSSRDKQLIITFGNKEGHRWEKYNQGKSSIFINDKNGPVLHLYRGRTYLFCIEEGRNTFLLTDSPVGGPNSKPIPGGFAPISKGCVRLTVDKFTPRYFYYQSSLNMFEGGLIIVHDV